MAKNALVLRGGTVVDAHGVRQADVRMEDGRIVAVGDVDVSGARKMNVSGRFVTPGLIDCHTHVVLDGGPDTVAHARRPRDELLLVALRNARANLKAGVTTARDIGSTAFVDVLVRDLVAAGLAAGPRMFVAGHFLTMTGGHAHYMGREADGVDECRKAAREQLKGGADWLKVMATGGVLTPLVDPRAPQLNEDEMRAVVEEGRKAGRWTAAHAHGGGGIGNAVRAGVRSVEHGTYLTPALADLMKRKGAYYVPTCVASVAILEDEDVPGWARRKAQDAVAVHEKSFRLALRKGLKIALGTDAGTPSNHHGKNARELAVMVEYGMTPKQALAAGTVVAAEMLGVEKEVGLVREGYAADLLVLTRHPLEDIGAFATALDAVIQAGTVAGP